MKWLWVLAAILAAGVGFAVFLVQAQDKDWEEFVEKRVSELEEKDPDKQNQAYEDLLDARKTMTREARAVLIQRLLVILKRTTSGKRFQFETDNPLCVQLAITLLGEFRANEAAEILPAFLAFPLLNEDGSTPNDPIQRYN